MGSFDLSAVADLATGMGLALSALLMALAVHEAGHVLAGRLVGIPIRSVAFGVGRPFLAFRLGGLRISFALFLIPALTRSYYSHHVGRMARAAFLLGGVGLNVLVAAPFFVASRWVDSDPAYFFFLYGASGQALFVIANLWPYQRKDKHGRVHISDGARLKMLIAEDQDLIRRARTALLARFVPYGEPPAKLDAAAVRVLALIDEARSRDFEERRRQCEDLELERARPHLLSVHLLFLDGALTKLLCADRDADAFMLEQWSAELARLNPDLPTVHGTLGSALALLGRYGEAKAELLRAVDGSPFDRFMSSAFLARAEFGLGDRAAAERALAVCYDLADAYPAIRPTEYWPLAERFAAEIGWTRTVEPAA